jgi:hypothetical protein
MPRHLSAVDASYVEVAANAAAANVRQHERADEWRPAVGADQEGMPPVAELAAVEQSLARRAIPMLRNRWPEYEAACDRLADLDARAAEVAAVVESLREQLRHVDDLDADRLRQWHEDDRRGPRPEPQRADLEQRLHVATVEANGLGAAIAAAEQARVDVVVRRRRVLVRDASELVEQRRAEAEAALVEAERARAALVEAAEHRLWSRVFPDPSASTRPPYEQVGAGLPLKVGGEVVDYAETVEKLHRDLASVVDVMAPEHRRLLVQAGEVEDVHDPSAAHWGAEEPRSERQRREAEVVRLFVEEYGHEPLNSYEFDQYVNYLTAEQRLPL